MRNILTAVDLSERSDHALERALALARQFEAELGGGGARVVLDQIAKQHPDLLALGTHGRTGIARAVPGSVARTLLQDPPCDVLAVRGW